jgi:hypothetical protein
LLYNIKSYEFVPIDHVLCFNGNNLDKDPYLISDNDSILTTPLLSRFFSRPLQLNPNEVRLKLIESFRRDINLCYEALSDFLAHIPLDWNPDRDYLNSRLAVFFTHDWIESCLELFTKLFTLNIKNQ